MVATWPVGLPIAFYRDGYEEAAGETRRKSATDKGPGKVFRNTSAPAAPFTLGVRLSSDQVDTLKEFIADDLAEGSLPFELVDPRTGDTLLVRFASDRALPAYRPARGGTHWNTTLNLEILP